MRSLEVREYVTAEGRIPYREWLSGLDLTARARVQARIVRFEQGNLGDYKSVGAGVLEARLMFGPGYRIYFGLDGDTIVLLLCGGDKSTQKRDVQRAQGYWDDYCESANKG